MRILPAFAVLTLLTLSLAASAQTHADAGSAEGGASVLEDNHSPGTMGNVWNDPSNVRESVTPLGSTGLLNVSSATLGPQHVLRFTGYGEYFSTSNFPVEGASNTRTAATFSLSYVALPFLQAYLAYGAWANTNSSSAPQLIQVLGNLTLGAKASYELFPGLSAGLDLRAQAFSAVGNQVARDYAFGFAPLLVGTYDFHPLAPYLPLRLHANLGFLFDNTRDLASGTLDAAEQYALGINRYNRGTVALGLEAPLPIATPFAEYKLEVPLGVSGGVLYSPDGTSEPIARILPETVDLGVRVTATRDLTVTAAAAFAVTRNVGLGVPAVAPWNLFLGLSYAVDPLVRSVSKGACPLVERIAAPPVTGQVQGLISDAKTREPVGGAVLTFLKTGVPPVATDAKVGRYLTQGLPPGSCRVQISKEGYEGQVAEVRVRAGEIETLNVALVPVSRLSKLKIALASKGQPVTATVQLSGAVEKRLEATGATAVDVPGGRYTLEVSATGYLSQIREVQISDGAQMAVSFDLAPEPKKKLVVVKNDKIEILHQVHFEQGKARIEADSFPLLDQVVDAIIKSNAKRLRVEGHTDNKGSKAANLKLSQDRAQAVADYLIHSGIDASHLEVKGFGDSRPVAPNLTLRGRQLNRRVEFVILER